MAKPPRFSPPTPPLENSKKCDIHRESDLIFDKLFTKKQLCEKLDVSLAFIDKLMANGEIPYIKIGKAVRFQQEKILVWLQRKSKP
jgi:excisionase family DNA binding protein